MLISISTNAKTFTKCELAKKLDSSGISRASLPDCKLKRIFFLLYFINNYVNIGICLVQHESSFKTHKKGRQNRNKSYDWGIFQINDKYWCKVGSAGGDCNIDCNSEYLIMFISGTLILYVLNFLNRTID